jgi:hypothetical protein
LESAGSAKEPVNKVIKFAGSRRRVEILQDASDYHVSQERPLSMEFTDEVARWSTIQPPIRPTVQDHAKHEEMITKIRKCQPFP